MSDPKGEKPESDLPHEDDLPFEFQAEHEDVQPEHEAAPAADEELPFVDASMSASMDEFQFSGPAEELDFTEPSDFNFPTEPESAADTGAGESSQIEHAEAEQFFAAEDGFGTEEGSHIGSDVPEAIAAESELAGEGIADLEPAEEAEGEEVAAEEPYEEEEAKVKPKRQLPAWANTVEWVTVALMATAGLAALIVAPFYMIDPKQTTLTLNIACGLLLALIPYGLWRSSARWTKLPVTALYTIMLALGTGALIAGTWLEGMELSSYDWQFSKTRVRQAMPAQVVMEVKADAPLDPPKPPSPDEAPAAAPAKDSSEPAAAPAPAPADSAAPAPAKDTAAPAK